MSANTSLIKNCHSHSDNIFIFFTDAECPLTIMITYLSHSETKKTVPLTATVRLLKMFMKKMKLQVLTIRCLKREEFNGQIFQVSGAVKDNKFGNVGIQCQR